MRLISVIKQPVYRCSKSQNDRTVLKFIVLCISDQNCVKPSGNIKTKYTAKIPAGRLCLEMNSQAWKKADYSCGLLEMRQYHHRVLKCFRATKEMLICVLARFENHSAKWHKRKFEVAMIFGQEILCLDDTEYSIWQTRFFDLGPKFRVWWMGYFITNLVDIPSAVLKVYHILRHL